MRCPSCGSTEKRWSLVSTGMMPESNFGRFYSILYMCAVCEELFEDTDEMDVYFKRKEEM